MAEKDMLTRHEREIGELRGKLDSLATKEFVRSVVNEQTQELNRKFDAIDRKFDAIDGKLNSLNEKQFRFIGAADFLKAVLPLLISIATLIVLILSLIAR